MAEKAKRKDPEMFQVLCDELEFVGKENSPDYHTKELIIVALAQKYQVALPNMFTANVLGGAGKES